MHQLGHVHINNNGTCPILTIRDAVLLEMLGCTRLFRKEYESRPLTSERDLLPLPQNQVNNICFPDIF